MSQELYWAGQGCTSVQYEVSHVRAAIDARLDKHMPASLQYTSSMKPLLSSDYVRSTIGPISLSSPEVWHV